MTSSRDQILADMTAHVLSEATRTVVLLENDGIDASAAIRMVRTALRQLAVTEAGLAESLITERRRSELEDAPDDRELGGQG
jgi:hypothetical protein